MCKVHDWICNVNTVHSPYITSSFLILWIVQVLVNNMDTIYGTCDAYCQSIGCVCIGAWDDDLNTCGAPPLIVCWRNWNDSDLQASLATTIALTTLGVTPAMQFASATLNHMEHVHQVFKKTYGTCPSSLKQDKNHIWNMSIRFKTKQKAYMEHVQMVV